MSESGLAPIVAVYPDRKIRGNKILFTATAKQALSVGSENVYHVSDKRKS